MVFILFQLIYWKEEIIANFRLKDYHYILVFFDKTLIFVTFNPSVYTLHVPWVVLALKRDFF